MIPERFTEMMEVIKYYPFKEYETVYSINFEEPIEDKPIVLVYHYIPGSLISDLRDAGFTTTIFVSLQYEHCLEVWVDDMDKNKNDTI